MTSTIDTATETVKDALQGRRLIWFGIRGEDGEALLQLPELAASYAITAPLRSGRIDPEANVTLEALAAQRPDLDRYDLDMDASEAAAEFRRKMLREVSGRCVLMTYRPAAVVSALAFSMADTMTLAGLFKDRQSVFEHKPWVERSLEARGVRGLGWHYVADEHKSRAKRMLDANGALILRPSRTSGGVGIAHVSSPDDIDRYWPDQPDAFVAVAPFLDPGVPVNFSGCVFDDGTVTLHPPSVQLIGIPTCVDRRFGYCGNDFAAASSLEPAKLEQLHQLGQEVGRWLHSERYRGVFGVDALLHEGVAHFVEVNARFQGSSGLSAEIAAELGVPDLFLDHLAAALGALPPSQSLTLVEWAARQPAHSQIVIHNLDGRAVRRSEDRLLPRIPGARLAQLPDERLTIDPGASLCRFTVPRSVTQTGFELDQDAEDAVSRLRGCFEPVTS